MLAPAHGALGAKTALRLGVKAALRLGVEAALRLGVKAALRLGVEAALRLGVKAALRGCPAPRHVQQGTRVPRACGGTLLHVGARCVGALYSMWGHGSGAPLHP